MVQIQLDDSARIRLLCGRLLSEHVRSIPRGIEAPNAEPN